MQTQDKKQDMKSDSTSQSKSALNDRVVDSYSISQKSIWLLLTLVACTGAVFLFSDSIFGTDSPTVPPRQHRNVHGAGVTHKSSTSSTGRTHQTDKSKVERPVPKPRTSIASQPEPTQSQPAEQKEDNNAITTPVVPAKHNYRMRRSNPRPRRQISTNEEGKFEVQYKDCTTNPVLQRPMKLQFLTNYKPEELIVNQITRRNAMRARMSFGLEHEFAFRKDEFTYTKGCRAYFDALLAVLNFRTKIDYAPVAASQYFLISRTKALLKFSQYERHFMKPNLYSLILTEQHGDTLCYHYCYQQYIESSALYTQYKPCYDILKAQHYKQNVFPIKFDTGARRNIYFYNKNFFVIDAEHADSTYHAIRFLVIFNPNIDIPIPGNLTHLLRRTLSDELETAKQYNKYLDELASICGTVIDFFERLCGIRMYLENHSYCQQSEPIFHIQIKFPDSATRMTPVQFNTYIENIK